MWLEQAVILINHYGLSMLDPRAQEFMKIQMEAFFFGEDAAAPEGWTPPAQPAKGQRKK